MAEGKKVVRRKKVVRKQASASGAKPTVNLNARDKRTLGELKGLADHRRPRRAAGEARSVC